MQAKVFLTGVCVGMTFADKTTKPHAKIYYKVKSRDRDLHCLAIVWLYGDYRELRKIFRPRNYVSITGNLISLSYKGRNNNTRAAIALSTAEYLKKKMPVEDFEKVRSGLRSMKKIYYEFFELKNQQGIKYYMNRSEVELPSYIVNYRKKLKETKDDAQSKKSE